ncbi:hypothetical protein AOZ07_11435 [Glutamicibacter halophytocola]|uniref:hypothetical protein n=1 Tax=Glutamicibacter halophytocola TaxID=1933880 RepID=UPI0006D4A769|nr:hypothetical protein [Glutamicibacter halophytocola]ALG29530.1 hypothetical protein AOZ07_11435 [Glutamicibacter halophytocola]
MTTTTICPHQIQGVRFRQLLLGDGRPSVCEMCTDAQTRALVAELDSQATSIGVKRVPPEMKCWSLNCGWPYGADIDLAARQSMVAWARGTA